MLIAQSMTRLGVSLLAASMAMPPALAATNFCDAFKSKTDPNWADQAGAWAIVSHKYHATQPNNNPLTYTDLVNFQSLQNFTLTVNVNDVYDGGIWLRSHYNAGAPNGVLLIVGGACSQFTGLYWHVVHDGVAGQCLNVTNVPGLGGSTAKLKVVVKGSTYTAYVGGKMITSLTDSTYDTGSAGLYDNSAAPQQTYSRFCVTSK